MMRLMLISQVRKWSCMCVDMFLREGLDVSVVNVWAVEINNATYTYELSRPNRHFRVEFDVTKPVELPPAPWGFEG